MKNFKKILIGILSCAIIVSAAGCGKKASTDNSEVTELKMVLVGETPKRSDEIYAELNKMLEKDIGARVNVTYIPYASLSSKYQLLFSSNEDFDLVYSANWLSYQDNAKKSSFYELTDDFIKKNAPKTYETMPEAAWKQATVDGKIFMVPNNGIEFETYVMLIRGDIREKLGIDKIDSVESFEKYVYGVAQNYKDITPITNINIANYVWYTVGQQQYNREFGGMRNGIMYQYNDKKGKVFKHEYRDAYETHLNKVRDLVEDGIIPPDLMANQSTDKMFENGTAAVYATNLETIVKKYDEFNKAHPEWKLEFCDLSGDAPQRINAYTNNGISINRNSKNADKAMQLIDLLRNDKRYFNLTWYGIEDKDWKDCGDGKYEPIADKNGNYFDLGCVWGWKNQDMLKTSVNEKPFKTATMEKWINNAYHNDVDDFVVDISPFKTELTSLSDVSGQYGKSLQYGMIEKNQIHKKLEEYRKKMNDAGLQTILDECNKQVSEYLKNK